MRIVQPSLQLILEVMDIHLRIFESFPPQIQVTVTGAVPSRGWSHPQLIPYTYVQPPTGARGSSRAALVPPYAWARTRAGTSMAAGLRAWHSLKLRLRRAVRTYADPWWTGPPPWGRLVEGKRRLFFLSAAVCYHVRLTNRCIACICRTSLAHVSWGFPKDRQRSWHAQTRQPCRSRDHVPEGFSIQPDHPIGGGWLPR